MEAKVVNYGDNNILEILKELEVENPKDINKFNALQLASLFPKLSESAFETLFIQVPNFFNLLEDGLKAEKDIVSKALDNNAENMKYLSDKFDIVLETISECQKKPDISFEESKYYMERMIDVLDLVSKKDTENKEFITKNVKAVSEASNKNKNMGLIILAGVAGAGLFALGVVTNNPYLTQKATKDAIKKAVEISEKKL